MRDLFLKFRKDESGASLVEYAVALIVVTIIGGAGVIVLGQNAGSLATAGCQTGEAAVNAVAGVSLASDVTTPTAIDC